ncbi:hypothetical protein I2I11_02275 [Pontibacter sp. 172403-2]|uniref:hypothetical protein n=1 Tax=Pontibacter rufus TaxID=2791028 RepID=UPI0018AFFC80|nr:hypothetical protein [Pontibacter sp. 172403-2]MBF9252110.1 hypothetical protein [Pontibacter sp. 172403-2]
MAERHLYGDGAKIEELLREMELVELAAGGWAAVYKHNATGAFWMKYHTMSGSQGGGYVQLIRLPLPSTEQLISIALYSQFEDEALAAILRLVDEEAIEQKDFRHQLLNQLEEQNLSGLSSSQKLRIQRIIKLSALDNPMNRWEVLNKSAAQVQQEALYFKTAADRAKLLLKRVL